MILGAGADRQRQFLLLGAISGFLTVALGAFGAHLLEARLTPDRLEWFRTGVRWQGMHAVAILAAGLAAGRFSGRFAPAAGWLFALGTVVFCGSLYVMAGTGIRVLGAIVPVGGLLWLLGWAALAMAAVKPRELLVEIGPEPGDVTVREGDASP